MAGTELLPEEEASDEPLPAEPDEPDEPALAEDEPEALDETLELVLGLDDGDEEELLFWLVQPTSATNSVRASKRASVFADFMGGPSVLVLYLPFGHPCRNGRARPAVSRLVCAGNGPLHTPPAKKF